MCFFTMTTLAPVISNYFYLHLEKRWFWYSLNMKNKSATDLNFIRRESKMQLLYKNKNINFLPSKLKYTIISLLKRLVYYS
jgi:hypothetical protein